MYALVNKYRYNPAIIAEDMNTLLKMYEDSEIKVVNKHGLYYKIYEKNESNKKFYFSGEYIIRASMVT